MKILQPIRNDTNTNSAKIIPNGPLKGEIIIRGYKNSMPKDLVAAMLTDKPCVLRNVSHIRDIEIMTDMIKEMGGEVIESIDGVLEINPKNIKPLSLESIKRYSGISRIPTLTAGPMLARFGETFLPTPGGCTIGQRPIDFHINALEKMGAVLHQMENGLKMTATKLKGAKIRLDYPSVGATEQILMAAVLADGVTEISNAAVEPDILDLILVLQKMGAYISVDTDRVIQVTGVEKLNGYDHQAMPDRNEAVSWACAAAATNGSIFLRGVKQIDLMTFLNKFRQAGGGFEVKNDGILFYRAKDLEPVVIETDVHPGFMTDWQQPFVIMQTQAEGSTVIHETVYEDRLGYVEALNKMGANIQTFKECLGGKTCRFGQRNHRHSAVIVGKTPLHGENIDIPDLRAGFSYIIAALVAEGESNLTNISLINRGYENLSEKLLSLGAKIIINE